MGRCVLVHRIAGCSTGVKRAGAGLSIRTLRHCALCRLLAIAALHHELYSVVAATLLGSILSNLLLVMGTSFFVGGCNCSC